jgi:hypothetical protein
MAKIDAVDETERLYTALRDNVCYIFAYVVLYNYYPNIYISVILSARNNKHENDQ